MGITARLCPFTSSCVQRFRISGGKLGNHCKVMPVYVLLRAAIRDFRGSIWESLQGYARLRPLACSDSGFQGVNLGITARLCQFTPSCVQRFLISSPDLRIDAAPSLLHRRMARLSPPYQRFASDSIFSLPQRRMVPPAAVVATTKNSPPAAKSLGAGGDRMP